MSIVFFFLITNNNLQEYEVKRNKGVFNLFQYLEEIICFFGFCHIRNGGSLYRSQSFAKCRSDSGYLYAYHSSDKINTKGGINHEKKEMLLSSGSPEYAWT